MRAIKLNTIVEKKGKIILNNLPFKKGSRLEVIILDDLEKDDKLLKLSESSLNFWDNEIDDKVWNDV